MIEDLAVFQERKIVVFSQWRSMLRLAEWSTRDILGGSGAGAVFFTGAESQTQRNRAIVDFHERPEVKVMFLSDAGGVGLNLQRAANACINLELPWNPAVLEQRIGRIYRLGQRAPIDVYNLVNEYGIEARIANILGTKRALFASVFDGTSDEVTFEGASSFMARLERLVELPAAPAAAPIPTTEPESEELAPEELADRAPLPEAFTAPTSPDVASLFRALRVERTSTGALRIEAPPEAADALAALFEGMARLVSSASPPPS